MNNDKIKQALQDLVDCISETRGKDATKALENARAALDAQPEAEQPTGEIDLNELESLHNQLDGAMVPRFDAAGEMLSAWGRVAQFERTAWVNFNVMQRVMNHLLAHHMDKFKATHTEQDGDEGEAAAQNIIDCIERIAAPVQPASKPEVVDLLKEIDGLMDFAPHHSGNGMMRGGDYLRKSDVIDILTRCDTSKEASDAPKQAEPVAPLPLSKGWVHDGDCALNPATGERVPYPAAQPCQEPAQLDDLIERLLDAQQDINLAANETMSQPLCSAAALLGEVESVLRRHAALQSQPAPSRDALTIVNDLLDRDIPTTGEEFAAALQSQPAPEAGLSQPCQSISDEEILAVFHKMVEGEGFAMYEVTPGNMIAFARRLLGSAKTGEA